MAIKQQVLSMWTVYDKPEDFPHCFIARRFDVDKGGVSTTTNILISANIDRLRTVFKADGLVCMPRLPDDDPKIVETWF